MSATHSVSNRNRGAACSLVVARLCGRIEVHAHRSFVIGMDRHALQTQFPPSAIELRDGPQFRLPSFHSASITTAATNPIDTPINGLRTANQKEMFQSEFSGVGFLFMPLFSSVRRSAFQQFEISLGCPQRGCFNANRRTSALEHGPPPTDKHYSPLAATSWSALRCSCTNRCVRSLVQSRLTP